MRAPTTGAMATVTSSTRLHVTGRHLDVKPAGLAHVLEARPELADEDLGRIITLRVAEEKVADTVCGKKEWRRKSGWRWARGNGAMHLGLERVVCLAYLIQ